MDISPRSQYLASQLNASTSVANGPSMEGASAKKTQHQAQTYEDKVTLSTEGKAAQQSGKSVPREQQVYSATPSSLPPQDEIERLRNPEEAKLGVFEKAMQSALDRRMGIDRERLQELEEKIKEAKAKEKSIRNNKSLPEDKRNKMLEDVKNELQQLYELLEAEKKRMAEQAAEREREQPQHQTTSEKVLQLAL